MVRQEGSISDAHHALKILPIPMTELYVICLILDEFHCLLSFISIDPSCPGQSKLKLWFLLLTLFTGKELGCYQETLPKRTFCYNPANYHPSEMTSNLCKSRCTAWSTHQFKYIGLTQGGYCFCSKVMFDLAANSSNPATDCPEVRGNIKIIPIYLIHLLLL